MRWGIIDDNMRCVSIIESDNRPENSYRISDGETVRVGYRWAGWNWEAPRWTPLEFLGRFTESELDDIERRRPFDMGVRTFYRTASFAQEIVSDDPRTIAGMDYLQSIGVLTQVRKEQILNG